MLRLWIVALHLRYRYFADVPIHHSRKRKERNSPVLFANWFSPYPCGLWLKELKSSWWMPLLSVNRASDHQKPSTIVIYGLYLAVEHIIVSGDGMSSFGSPALWKRFFQVAAAVLCPCRKRKHRTSNVLLQAFILIKKV